MEKQTMINIISSRLSSIGVFCKNGAGSDITIQTEFLNAAWGSGNKKLEYHASAFLNEVERTLYFWEYTKESGLGFSFGSDSETSFQSGTTLFRKVKSVGYGPDGRAFEYNLDIGAITKAFKETAKQHGWKFKVVLKREKAIYPPGYVVPIINNSQHPENSGQTPQVEPQNQPPYYQQPQNSFQQGFNNQREPFQVSTNQSKWLGKMGVLFWIAFIFTTLFTVYLFIDSKTSIVGWVLTGVVFSALFLLRGKMLNKGCLISVIAWIVSIIVIFTIYAATSDTSTSNKTKAPASEQKSSASVQNSSKSPAVFAVSAIRSNIYAHVDSKVVNYESLYKPHADITTFVDFTTVGSLGDENTKISQISFDNMNVTNKPKMGTVTFYVDFTNPSTDDTKFSAQTSYKKDYTSSTYIQGMSITVFMKVDNIKDYFKVPQGTAASDKVLGLVASWQDIKYTLEFDMNVTTKDGSVYSRHIAITMPQGDFMNDTNASIYDVKYDLKNDLAKAMLIKK